MVEQILGFTFSFCFCACYWPQIIMSLRTKNVEGISLHLFSFCIVGYISAMTYTILKIGLDLWLLANYSLSLISVLIMVGIYFKYKK